MIKSKSQFFYGIEIDQNNKYLDFQEGTNPPLVAELKLGLYSPQQFANELSIAMNLVGDGEYVWTFDRVNKKLTVTADITFSLLTFTGPNALNGLWSVIGITGADKTGAFTYTATGICGKTFRPQFLLQGYMSTGQNKAPVESSLNITGSGKRELVRFGTEQLMECSIPYITNIYQPIGGPIEYNPNGFENSVDLMEFLIRGGNVEFMADRTLPNDYEILQLKSTSESDTGISYRVEEMQDMGLQNYFRINKLTFRKIL